MKNNENEITGRRKKQQHPHTPHRINSDRHKNNNKTDEPTAFALTHAIRSEFFKFDTGDIQSHVYFHATGTAWGRGEGVSLVVRE